MARDLNLRLALMAALALAAAAASGQERARATNAPLADPTRPPSFIPFAGVASPAALPGPVLQSVLISPARKSAIISGQSVALGGKYGESRLTGLTDAEAVLEGPQGRTVLRLIPTVEKSTSAEPRADRVPR